MNYNQKHQIIQLDNLAAIKEYNLEVERLLELQYEVNGMFKIVLEKATDQQHVIDNIDNNITDTKENVIIAKKNIDKKDKSDKDGWEKIFLLWFLFFIFIFVIFLCSIVVLNTP